jgi:phage-related minor tail protein
MAERIKGIIVEIGGDAQGLDKALNDVNSTSRNLQKELNDVNRLLKFDPANVEALAQKQKLLNDQVVNTSEKLNRLREVEQQVEQQFNLGEISEQQFRAFRREIEFTEKQLSNLKESLNIKADTSQAVKSLGRLKQAAKEVESEIDDVKTGFAGMGAGAAAGVGGLVAGMQEYNEVLARLRTNAALANNDLGLVEQAFQRTVEVTGEADAAGETLANLLASGVSDAQLLPMIELVNGAYIKFSDTLKTEGIADGIQETFATGKAVGPFAELLERSGVSLEDFDKKLAATGTDAEKTNLIMQTMSELGFGKVTEKYREMNPEVQKTAEANASLQKSLGELAILFAPLVSMITGFITKLVEWMTANPGLTITIVGIVAAIGALIAIGMAFAPVLGLITGLAGALNIAMLPVTLTILGIVAAIGLAVAAFIWWKKNGDEVMKKAAQMEAFIKAKFAAITRKVIDEMKKVIGNIKEVWGNIMDFFEGIDLKKIGKDIIQGLIDGIKSMAKKVEKAAKNIANGIGEKVKSILQLGSPSKLMIDYGEDTGEGLAIGLNHSINEIGKMAQKMATAVIPRMPKMNTNNNAATSKAMTVNIHSPKALDAREATFVWNRQMKKMALQW